MKCWLQLNLIIHSHLDYCKLKMSVKRKSNDMHQIPAVFKLFYGHFMKVNEGEGPLASNNYTCHAESCKKD